MSGSLIYGPKAADFGEIIWFPEPPDPLFMPGMDAPYTGTFSNLFNANPPPQWMTLQGVFDAIKDVRRIAGITPDSEQRWEDDGGRV